MTASLRQSRSVRRPRTATKAIFGPRADGNEVLAIYHKFSSNEWTLAGTLPVGELVKDAQKIYNLTIYVSIGAALLALLLGYVVIRQVGMPLLRLRDLMNEGRRGNLTVRSRSASTDEIGQLSASFNEMMEQIKGLVEETRESADEVLATAGEVGDASRRTAIAAREIAAATEEIAGGATSLAVEAERGSELTADMDISMRRVKLGQPRHGRSGAACTSFWPARYKRGWRCSSARPARPKA